MSICVIWKRYEKSLGLISKRTYIPSKGIRRELIHTVERVESRRSKVLLRELKLN